MTIRYDDQIVMYDADDTPVPPKHTLPWKPHHPLTAYLNSIMKPPLSTVRTPLEKRSGAVAGTVQATPGMTQSIRAYHKPTHTH